MSSLGNSIANVVKSMDAPPTPAAGITPAALAAKKAQIKDSPPLLPLPSEKLRNSLTPREWDLKNMTPAQTRAKEDYDNLFPKLKTPNGEVIKPKPPINEPRIIPSSTKTDDATLPPALPTRQNGSDMPIKQEGTPPVIPPRTNSNNGSDIIPPPTNNSQRNWLLASGGAALGAGVLTGAAITNDNNEKTPPPPFQ